MYKVYVISISFLLIMITNYFNQVNKIMGSSFVLPTHGKGGAKSRGITFIFCPAEARAPERSEGRGRNKSSMVVSAGRCQNFF